VDALHCRKVSEKVRVHGRTRVKKVTRCHARTTKRRITITVTVHRHGKKVRVKRHKTIRVLVLPKMVEKSEEFVGHGESAIVNGWLGTADGTALAGQPIKVLTAPDDGQGSYSVAARATTAANGGWSAQLPPGPSRVVVASYAGGSTTEPTMSLPAHLEVPAQVKLIGISPRNVPWGGTIHLVGQLTGGYLPPGGALVRLRIGYGRAYTTYGVQEHVTGSGEFSTTYTFGAGDPAVRRSYWFQIASLPMGNYPYAPASSRRVSVIVGGHPRKNNRPR
jgi:hypothetical protein